MTTSEAEGIIRLKHGNIGGLETLVRAHQVEATRAAHLIVRDTQAEDIVQDAFLLVRRRVEQLERYSSLSEPVTDSENVLEELLADADPGPGEQVGKEELRAAI